MSTVGNLDRMSYTFDMTVELTEQTLTLYLSYYFLK